MKTEYEKKFKNFTKALKECGPDDVFMVHHPEVLGDNYEEIVESLNRLSETTVRLVIVPRSERKHSR